MLEIHQKQQNLRIYIFKLNFTVQNFANKAKITYVQTIELKLNLSKLLQNFLNYCKITHFAQIYCNQTMEIMGKTYLQKTKDSLLMSVFGSINTD